MTSDSEKICILLKSVGNAPVLKKDKFMLGKTTKLRLEFKADIHGFHYLMIRSCRLDSSYYIEDAKPNVSV